MVSDAGDYAWSSAPTRLSDSNGSEFLDLASWRRSYSPEQWRDVLERGIREEAQLERIREATRRGRPLGTADFIQSVALQLGRALDRRKAGRPRKDTADRVDSMLSGKPKWRMSAPSPEFPLGIPDGQTPHEFHDRIFADDRVTSSGRSTT
jgi:hypothetical protein